MGMLLDCKFMLLAQIKTLVMAQCQRDLNLIRMLRGTSFGSDKNLLLPIHESVFIKLSLNMEMFLSCSWVGYHK